MARSAVDLDAGADDLNGHRRAAAVAARPDLIGDLDDVQAGTAVEVADHGAYPGELGSVLPGLRGRLGGLSSASRADPAVRRFLAPSVIASLRAVQLRLGGLGLLG